MNTIMPKLAPAAGAGTGPGQSPNFVGRIILFRGGLFGESMSLTRNQPLILVSHATNDMNRLYEIFRDSSTACMAAYDRLVLVE